MSDDIIVWNSHWFTMGGGERYAAELASSLQKAGHKVTIAGTLEDPRELLNERLGINCAGLNFLPCADESSLPIVLRQFNVFINSSYGSRYIPADIRSIYICFFPFRLSRYFRLHHYISCEFGTFITDSGQIMFPQIENQLFVSHSGWLLEGKRSSKRIDNQDILNFNFSSQKDQNNWKVTLAKEKKNWKKVEISKKHLDLIVLTNIKKINLYTYLLLKKWRQVFFHLNYQEVWSISQFTHAWLGKRWQRESDILYPPVSDSTALVPKLERNPYQIVGVGRFMNPRDGHGKNQHQLIKAFRLLCTQSDLPWKLVLIGGLDARAVKYVEKLRKSSIDLNIEIRLGISQVEVESEYMRSSYFWHATGMKVKESKPERHEHFGITVVEAIKRGLIPFVYGSAGPAEILRNQPELHFNSAIELARKQLNILGLEQEAILESLKVVGKKYEMKNFHSRVLELYGE